MYSHPYNSVLFINQSINLVRFDKHATEMELDGCNFIKCRKTKWPFPILKQYNPLVNLLSKSINLKSYLTVKLLKIEISCLNLVFWYQSRNWNHLVVTIYMKQKWSHSKHQIPVKTIIGVISSPITWTVKKN